jgi:hypothetical protein
MHVKAKVLGLNMFMADDQIIVVIDVYWNLKD